MFSSEKYMYEDIIETFKYASCTLHDKTGISQDPVNEVSNLGVDARVVGTGTAVAPGHDAGQVGGAGVRASKGAARVTLARVLAALGHSGTDHGVVAGEHNRDVDEGNEQTIVLSKIIQHEDYNGFTISNDISLLKLSQPLTFNDYVGPIALPEAGHAASGECIVSGWGALSEGGSSPSVLQKVSVPIVSDAECRDAYGQNDIDDSMICAGVPEGGKDSCQGDSGGPLACSDTGSPYLAGIVSWGYGCARPNYPGVYTEVAYFVDWVLANAV
ncbi:trypsin-1-like [Penaeus chinensis]|uniref:trypsin-1-like n=1 Tax=Penaeus chinensis TaxID=139456 RepID=UPI001FB5D5F3|nr:trypsin-1-like [Penaeus chinensis]